MTHAHSIDALRSLLLSALSLRDIGEEDAAFIADDYLEAELEGHKTHGLSKFLTLDIGLSRRDGSPEIVQRTACSAKIDGHRELGHIAARRAAQLSIELAEKSGIGIVAMHNVSRYARLAPYGKLIAQAGLVGIVTNNGGPAHVTAHGGKTPLFGTNPLCFSFPCADASPLVFDFATAKSVWGELRQASVEQRPLPEKTFLDASGSFTLDPDSAFAMLPFGGSKGYALCFALEILSGAFTGSPMGPEIESEYDLGYLFAALSPALFSDAETFSRETAALAAHVRASQPIGGAKVFVPGEHSAARRREALAVGCIELEDEVYDRLLAMSRGLSGGFADSRKMN